MLRNGDCSGRQGVLLGSRHRAGHARAHPARCRPPKRLALLSPLVLRAPCPVSLRDAVDVLWDDEPPVSAVNIVHRNISALRKLLEPGLSNRAPVERLSRSADGYRLLLDTSTSDLLRFRELRTRAQLAVKDGDAAEAALHFTDALRLWRSPVVADGTYVSQHPAFTSVGGEFVAAAKEAADVVLTAAPASTEEVLTALRRAVERHPFDEALHAHIITALATTGRQAEALEQFERIRRTLADELGVEPGAALRSVQQRFLRKRRQNSMPMRQAGPVALGPVHLPHNSVPFVGRAEVLNRCRQLLPTAAPGSSAATTVVAVGGMAGVGKTTLAVHWARQSTEHFPDGQIHVDLQGYHPTRAPSVPRRPCAPCSMPSEPVRQGKTTTKQRSTPSTEAHSPDGGCPCSSTTRGSANRYALYWPRQRAAW